MNIGKFNRFTTGSEKLGFGGYLGVGRGIKVGVWGLEIGGWEMEVGV